MEIYLIKDLEDDVIDIPGICWGYYGASKKWHKLKIGEEINDSQRVINRPENIKNIIRLSVRRFSGTLPGYCLVGITGKSKNCSLFNANNFKQYPFIDICLTLSCNKPLLDKNNMEQICRYI